MLISMFFSFLNVFQPVAMPASLPPPIRMRVRVQEDVFLIPVPQRLVLMSLYVNFDFMHQDGVFGHFHLHTLIFMALQ